MKRDRPPHIQMRSPLKQPTLTSEAESCSSERDESSPGLNRPSSEPQASSKMLNIPSAEGDVSSSEAHHSSAAADLPPSEGNVPSSEADRPSSKLEQWRVLTRCGERSGAGKPLWAIAASTNTATQPQILPNLHPDRGPQTPVKKRKFKLETGGFKQLYKPYLHNLHKLDATF